MSVQKIFWGKVIHGKKRGRALGYPTVNIQLHRKIDEGVYVCHATLQKRVYNALAFIGSAKTFGEHDYKAEVHILNFSKDLYGEFVSVRLLKKLRGNIKFDTSGELVKQMELDKKEAIAYFQNV